MGYDLWVDYVENEKTGLYLPLQDELESAKYHFLQAPGSATYEELKKAFKEKCGDNHLAELTGFLEGHFPRLPRPWTRLILAYLYMQSYRLAEAEYELAQALSEDENAFPNECYALYLQVLLRRKRWQRALDITRQWIEKVKSQASIWLGIAWYYAACAQMLAGDAETALANLETAEQLGYKEFRVKLLKLKIATRTSDFQKQLSALEEVKAEMPPMDEAITKEVRSLEKEIRHNLIQKIASLLLIAVRYGSSR